MNTKPTIGLVMKSLQAEFFQEMKKGALAFAASQNNFELITVGTNTQTEINLQIALWMHWWWFLSTLKHWFR
jgi:ribose transport system substrate-binding protein